MQYTIVIDIDIDRADAPDTADDLVHERATAAANDVAAALHGDGLHGEVTMRNEAGQEIARWQPGDPRGLDTD